MKPVETVRHTAGAWRVIRHALPVADVPRAWLRWQRAGYADDAEAMRAVRKLARAAPDAAAEWHIVTEAEGVGLYVTKKS